MKKVLLLVCMAASLAACASGGAGINAVPAKLTKAVAAADKTCQTDADCVAVQKGCCPCAGFEAVNKAAAKALQSRWNKECADGVCTLEMCYVELNTSCQNGTCVGTLKPMKDYFVR